MIRGTTPDFLLTVNADLVDKAVFVTISQPRTRLTLTGDDLGIASDGTNSVIQIRLTQKQTLALSVGKADIQVRFIDENGIARATEIKTLDVTRVLLERVIHYD